VIGSEEAIVVATTQQSPDRIPSGVVDAVRGNTRTALDLYRTQRNACGNIFFSPYCISAALALAYAGARGNTAAQMARALRFDPDPHILHPAFGALETGLAELERDGALQLRVASRLWPHTSCRLLEEYVTLVRRCYGASLTPLDYRRPEPARQVINAWAEERTGGRITDLIPPGILTSLTRLVLTNVIYFKGRWSSPFRLRLTRRASFWVTPDSAAQAQMMAQTHDFDYCEAGDVQVLDLPYGGGLSMIVLLPRARDGLAAIEDALTVENLDLWTASLSPAVVEVFLPRFMITFQVQLDAALESLGMVDAFTEQADFSGMDGTRRLFIGAALHKAFIKVNEEGAEAAAATALALAEGLSPPAPPVFRADHPFLFLIRKGRTGSILFLGRVIDPHQET
jgi:serpin B